MSSALRCPQAFAPDTSFSSEEAGTVVSVEQAPSAPGGLLLVARPSTEHAHDDRPAFSKATILAAVGRRSLPRLIEATVVPAILFYVLLMVTNGAVAMLGALGWAFLAVGRRIVVGDRVPGILLLATLGLAVRTLVGLASGSMFAYFVQPVATTLALAALFFGSVLFGRPVITRLAHDFCPIADDVAGRPEITRLFAGLTLLWAGVHLLSAAMTFTMLVSMSVPVFVVVKTISSMAITVAAVVFTVSWAIRIARREDLVLAHAVG
jgi:hypothetical protein